MTSALATRAPTLFDEPGGEATLDDVIAGAWRDLSSHRTVECPLCGGSMAPQYSAHARPIGGRCLTCGTTLSMLGSAG